MSGLSEQILDSLNRGYRIEFSVNDDIHYPIINISVSADKLRIVHAITNRQINMCRLTSDAFLKEIIFNLVQKLDNKIAIQLVELEPLPYSFENDD